MNQFPATDNGNVVVIDRDSMAGWSRADELMRPVTGERVRLLKTSTETDGAYVEGVSAFPPTLAETPLHEHPHQEERLRVVSGTLYVRMAGKQHLLGPGGSFVIPPGAAHEIANAGAETAEVVWQFVPALRTDTFLRTTLDAPQPARVGPLRRALKRLRVAAEFSDEYRRATLPWIMQAPVLALLRGGTNGAISDDERLPTGMIRNRSFVGERAGC
jgi:quercetin dioxygenase-like cupin family protein